MDAFDPTPFLIKLQHVVLDNEDSGSLTTKAGLHILTLLKDSGFEYQFLGALFFDANFKLQQAYCCDLNNPSLKSIPVNLSYIVQNYKELEKELLWGHAVLSKDINSFFPSQYLATNPLASFLIAPIFIARKLAGVMIIATKRKSEQIQKRELDIALIIANAIAQSAILQNTQTSLTHVTQEIYKMNAKLHQLDKLKDDFVSVASHELRTPMTAIRSYAWMALNRADVPLSEKLKRYLSRTLISTERLINLVNDMLNVSRIESGRIEIMPRAFSVVDLVSDVITEIEAKARERGVNIKISNPNVPKVFADPDKVHQVLLNLLGNALKFTPQGGFIYVSFFTDGKFVDVSVKDTGAGITKDDLSRLFTKFGRLDNSYVAAATSGGTGLGLYISKSLIELMKGKIWATSEGLGKGATFSFSLPVATPDVLTEGEKYTNKVQTGQVKYLEPVSI